MGRSGTPDILACIGGVFVALELKMDDGKLSALQDYNLKKITTCGGIALVVTPSNEEETLVYLETFARKLGESLPFRKDSPQQIKRKPRSHEH